MTEAFATHVASDVWMSAVDASTRRELPAAPRTIVAVAALPFQARRASSHHACGGRLGVQPSDGGHQGGPRPRRTNGGGAGLRIAQKGGRRKNLGL